MKRIILLFGLVVICACAMGQSADSVVVKPLSAIQKDSVLISINNNTKRLSNLIGSEYWNRQVGRYKMYRTTNIYNNLKLDTSNGRIDAVQIGINNDKARFQYKVCDAVETDYAFMINGRYELYPTGNNYNYILLDTFLGFVYQVQWSTDSNCGIWRIY